MWIDDDEYIVRCGCGDASHPTHFLFDTWHFKDIEHQELSISMYIDDANFWGRLKNAIFYLFKNRKFWHYGCISLDLVIPKEKEEVRGLIKFLNKCLKLAEGKK